MGRAKKVVLAYSGGVDTSVCIPYLKQEGGVEDVITFAADLGQAMSWSRSVRKRWMPVPVSRWWVT